MGPQVAQALGELRPGARDLHVARLSSRGPDLLEHVADRLGVPRIVGPADVARSLGRDHEHVARGRGEAVLDGSPGVGRGEDPPGVQKRLALPGGEPPGQAGQASVVRLDAQTDRAEDRVRPRCARGPAEHGPENRLPSLHRTEEKIEEDLPPAPELRQKRAVAGRVERPLDGIDPRSHLVPREVCRGERLPPGKLIGGEEGLPPLLDLDRQLVGPRRTGCGWGGRRCRGAVCCGTWRRGDAGFGFGNPPGPPTAMRAPSGDQATALTLSEWRR